jgi:hypothetical protein
VQVYNRNFADLPEVWMKLDKGKGGRAMITRGWTNVMAKFGMKAGDIYLFWFCRGLHGGLKHQESVVNTQVLMGKGVWFLMPSTYGCF